MRVLFSWKWRSLPKVRILCGQDHIDTRSRLLVWTTGTKVPHCFNDWWDLADYIKQENQTGQSVTVIKWEYV
jgi:hypothetical protein